jgi:hypothetical protein
MNNTYMHKPTHFCWFNDVTVGTWYRAAVCTNDTIGSKKLVRSCESRALAPVSSPPKVEQQK